MAYHYRKDLETLLNDLERCEDRTRLSKLWPEFFDQPIPRNLSTRILKFAVIYSLQVSLYFGKKGIDHFHSETIEGEHVTTVKALPMQIRLENGTVLKKKWKGQEIQVEVTDDKYLYENAEYSSLSEIAREITGTRWSGPRFFGLNV